jgi:hypothetical protein
MGPKATSPVDRNGLLHDPSRRNQFVSQGDEARWQ